ncbi:MULTISPECIES: teichoic acid D-Ala incorporation-associated protein DltX [Heyndrickxia]|nr:teichoic acid D-Ala incorporation-associated protein DltX [Heyndrickxia shackletonii]MBB2479038.1 teichoic acid D-Ala incorporation-associated protein DltX [Bacillus sp. APMAM]NEZ02001.1 teichoic acid D-Ala incorporation-associated protein DltX [Heyndrickxia shackletonii]RTZ57278.1 teichoic acid D-Ala incorporation-associated protein DltX [Bacillus sp. SAJ1]
MKKQDKKIKNPVAWWSLRTFYYLLILILLVLIYGFHDMSAGPFIYSEF